VKARIDPNEMQAGAPPQGATSLHCDPRRNKYSTANNDLGLPPWR
jgi:hypothetical protein